MNCRCTASPPSPEDASPDDSKHAALIHRLVVLLSVAAAGVMALAG